MTQWKSYSTEEQIHRTGLIVERFCELERTVNELLFCFIGPYTDAEDLIRLHLLDNSILSFASKIKLLQVIDRLKGTSHINRDELHRLLAIRNAFAHNVVGRNIEVEYVPSGLADTYFYIESIKGNGALLRVKRDDAYGEFLALCDSAAVRLAALHAAVRGVVADGI